MKLCESPDFRDAIHIRDWFTPTKETGFFRNIKGFSEIFWSKNPVSKHPYLSPISYIQPSAVPA